MRSLLCLITVCLVFHTESGLEEDDILCVEAGFIAQDIQNIPELAYSVTGGDYTESTEDSEGVVTTNEVASPHYLNYYYFALYLFLFSYLPTSNLKKRKVIYRSK